MPGHLGKRDAEEARRTREGAERAGPPRGGTGNGSGAGRWSWPVRGGAAADPHEVRELFDGAGCVVFDFDGPVCKLFAHHPVGGLARRLHGMFAGFDGLSSPHEVLRLAALGGADAAAVAEADRLVDGEEVAAAATSEPTPFADDLVEALARRGARLAVASNNSARSIDAYLARRGLSGHFGDRVFGRAPDPARMKPDPDCLLRCLAALGAQPRACVFIGDSPYDLKAADAAGVPFLGFGYDEAKAAALRAEGAGVVIGSIGEILDALGPSAPRPGDAAPRRVPRS